MKCIFCLKERPPGKEHIFPYAIGGRLTTDRVCGSCNPTLGSPVDAALTDYFPVRSRRAELGLAGQSGKTPGLYEILLGDVKLAEHPERRVRVTLNEATGKLDIKALYHAADVVMPDGTRARQIVVDERDRGQIPKIIEKEPTRLGLPPLSGEQLAAEVQRCTENITTTENPCVLIEPRFSFAYLRHAMVKIAYELAFLWLGELYLDDPSAAELRAAIMSADVASTNDVPGYVGDAQGCDAFNFWTPNKAHHLAYATVINQGVAVAVRVFYIHAAVILVTNHAARYLGGDPDDSATLRFLAIDAISGAMHNTSFIDERNRLAAVMRATQRFPPFPDPLEP